MKLCLLYLFVLLITLGYAQLGRAQTSLGVGKDSKKVELSKISEFITKSFPSVYKFQGPWKYFDANAQKEVETRRTEVNGLISFKDCNIRFSHLFKVQKTETDLSEVVSMSIKDIDPRNSGVRSDGPLYMFFFNAERNVIRSQRQYVSHLPLMNGDTNRKDAFVMLKSFGITLQATSELAEIERSFKRSIEICQALK